ncbi:MAG: hypothetical protein AB7O38_22440 [Pirellulaceae bacterium]
MIAQEVQAGKRDMAEQMTELRRFVETAARDGTPAHEVEHGLFRRLLSLGHNLLGEFFVKQGSGNLGEQITLSDGEVVHR